MITMATWEMALDSGSLNVRAAYVTTLALLAQQTYFAQSNDPLPEDTNPQEAAEGFLLGSAPSWWPTRLPRLQIRLMGTPHQGAPTSYGPAFLDVHGNDGGLKAMTDTVRMLMSQLPTPFIGNLRVEFFSGPKMYGAANLMATIGSVPKGMGGAGFGSEEPDPEKYPWLGKHNAALTSRLKRLEDAQLEMFSASTGVIQAAGSALGAMAALKGNDEGEGGWKEAVADIAAAVATKFFAKDDDQKKIEDKKAADRKLPELPGGTYPSEIDPDGQPDDWGDNGQPGDVQTPFSQAQIGTQDDADVVDEDHEEDEDEAAPTASGNPLEGLSEEEVERYMGQWLETADKKKVKKMAMKLASKVM